MEKYFYSEPDDFWCTTIYISDLDDDLKISLNEILSTYGARQIEEDEYETDEYKKERRREILLQKEEEDDSDLESYYELLLKENDEVIEGKRIYKYICSAPHNECNCYNDFCDLLILSGYLDGGWEK